MNSALVTGGAGFIGSHIVERLAAGGTRVRVLDNFSTGRRGNLSGMDGVEVVEGDITDAESVAAAVESMDVVFHQAAIASVPKTIEDPVGSSRTNYLGTLNILEAARKAGVERVVFASSAAVYGDDPVLPKTEDMPAMPLSPYAVDKLASEYACTMYTRCFGLATVCLRYFNVYGPRQDPSSPYSGVISVFADRLGAGMQPVIHGDGEQTRDFIYVGDVVTANLGAAREAGAAGGIFNVATGSRVSLNELLRTMASLCGQPFAPEYGPPRAGDIRHSLAAIERGAQAIGLSPAVGLEEGLASYLGDLNATNA